MEKKYTTDEVLEILQKCYITGSIQMVRKFIKEEKLKAEKVKDQKTGKKRYLIKEKNLIEFIEAKKPGITKMLEGFSGKKVTNQIINSDLRSDYFGEANFQQMNEHLSDLVHLMKLMNEKMDALIDQKDKGVKLKKTVTTDQHATKTLTQFKKHIEKKINSANLNNEDLMIEVYSIYYDEGEKMKSEVKKSTGEYTCPKTGLSDQRFVNLIKRSVPQFIKKKSEEKPYRLFDPDEYNSTDKKLVELEIEIK